MVSPPSSRMTQLSPVGDLTPWFYPPVYHPPGLIELVLLVPGCRALLSIRNTVHAECLLFYGPGDESFLEKRANLSPEGLLFL